MPSDNLSRMCMVSKDVCNQIHLFYPYTMWSHLYKYIGFLHTRTSSTLTKKKRREPSVGNSGDIYNWSLSSLSSWASQLPPQPQNWLNCPNTTKSSFNQTNNGINHCQRHYGPRCWLLWPVILVWFNMLGRLWLIWFGRFGLVGLVR